MREFLILLRHRVKGWRRGTRNTARQTGERLTLAGAAVFLFVNFALAMLVFSLFNDMTAPAFRAMFLRLAAKGLAASALALVIITAANTMLGSLYEAPYLSLVLAWPIKPRTLYAAGFCDALALNLGMAGGIIGPAWVALALATRAPWGFALAGLAGLLAEVLIGSAVVGLALTGILRFTNVPRLRQLFISALLVGLVGLILFIQFLGVAAMHQGWVAAMERFDLFLNLTGWLPNGLAAGSALAARDGRGLAALANAGLLYFIAIVFTAACIAAGGRTYAACWSNARETTGARAKFNAWRRRGGTPWPIKSFLVKDWLILSREPLFWANMAMVFLGAFFYAWCVKPNNLVLNDFTPLIRASHFFFLSFLATGWLALAGGMAVSREGSSWWQVQSAPLQAGQIFWAKFLFSASGLAAFFLPATIVVNAIGLRLPPLAITATLLAGLTVALAAAGILADLILPDFTLRLGVKMSGAHSGGKTKIVLAMAADFGATGLTGLTYILATLSVGPLWAAAAVLLEGSLILLIAYLAGGFLLRRVMVTA